MSNQWTELNRPLGSEVWNAGPTKSIQFDQELISGVTMIFKATGPNAPTVVQMLKLIERILVRVAGTDYVAISGWLLYAHNWSALGGDPPWSITSGNDRYLKLFLPFSMEGGVHAPDTALDLRRSLQKGLRQGSIRLELAKDAEVTSGQVDVYQHFYTVGAKQRMDTGVRQLRERTVAGAANQQFTIQFDHGSEFDDLASIIVVGINSNGNDFIKDPIKKITLTASEDGPKQIFHISTDEATNVIPVKLNQRPFNAGDFEKAIFRYDFLRGDEKGHNRTFKGLLDGSTFSNLILEATPGTVGTYHVLLDRIDVASGEPGAGN